MKQRLPATRRFVGAKHDTAWKAVGRRLDRSEALVAERLSEMTEQLAAADRRADALEERVTDLSTWVRIQDGAPGDDAPDGALWLSAERGPHVRWNGAWRPL